MSPVARRWIYAVLAAAAIGLVVVKAIGICAIRTSLIAEENLQAFFQAHRATIEYIQKHDGQWPNSWDDLHALRPESDFDWVAEHVAFDFGADPLIIITQTPDKFTAINPKQPCYIIDYEIEHLIDTLRKYHQPD